MDPVDEVVKLSTELAVNGIIGVPCLVHEEVMWQRRVTSLRKLLAQLHSQPTAQLMTYLEFHANKYSDGVLQMRRDINKVFLNFLNALQINLETAIKICNFCHVGSGRIFGELAIC